MSSQGNTLLNIIVAVKGAEALSKVNEKISEARRNLSMLAQEKTSNLSQETDRYGSAVSGLSDKTLDLQRKNIQLDGSIRKSSSTMHSYADKIKLAKNNISGWQKEFTQSEKTTSRLRTAVGKTLVQKGFDEISWKKPSKTAIADSIRRQYQVQKDTIDQFFNDRAKFKRAKDKQGAYDFAQENADNLGYTGNIHNLAVMSRKKFMRDYAKIPTPVAIRQQIRESQDIAMGKYQNETEQLRSQKVVDLRTKINEQLTKQAGLQQDINTKTQELSGLQSAFMKEKGNRQSLVDMQQRNKEEIKSIGLQQKEEKKKHNDAVKDIKERIGLRVRENQKQKESAEDAKRGLRDLSVGLTSAIFFTRQFFQALSNSLKELKEIKLAASISMGATNQIRAFRETSFGANVGDVGAIAKAVSRTPYSGAFSANIKPLIAYQKMIGSNPQQMLPILSGMKSMFKNVSMGELLNSAISTSTASSFDFSGWSSIMMQNTIPQMQTLGIHLGTVNAMLGGLSNLGMGPFASFGLTSMLDLASGGGTKEQQKMLVKLFGSKDAFQKMIENTGLFGALEELSKKINQFSAAEQLKITNTLFSGMGSGVASAMLNNVQTFKDLENKMYSPAYGKYQVASASGLTPYVYEQLTASASNLKVSFFDLTAETSGFRDLISGLNSGLTGLTGLLDGLKEFNKNNLFGKILSTGVSWSLVAASSFKLGQAIPGVLSKLKEYAPMVGLGGGSTQTPTTAKGKFLSFFGLGNLGGVPRGNVSATSATAGTGASAVGVMGGLSTITGGIFAIISIISMIRGSIDNYYRKKTEEGLEKRSSLEVALQKASKGETLTAREKRILSEFLGAGTDTQLKNLIEQMKSMFNGEDRKKKEEQKNTEEKNKKEKKDFNLNLNIHTTGQPVPANMVGEIQKTLRSTLIEWDRLAAE